MKYLITGAGQIGSELLRTLNRQGNDTVVIRRSFSDSTPDAILGDAGNHSLLREAAERNEDLSAIFHCIHAPYSPAAWRRELPHREQAVMDLGHELNIPVIFPESTYAFGTQVRRLQEGSPTHPCTPLGEVREELLAARRVHPARTVSVVAGDLVGPTADPAGSVPTMTVIDRVQQGKTGLVLGDPDAPHTMTYLPDLAKAMIWCASSTSADAVLHAPSPHAISLRELADLVVPDSTVRRLPFAPLGVAGVLSPTVRSLFQQRYLWTSPAVLEPGVLSDVEGLAPTPWEEMEL
ncbi:NAD-dependent epimerase/dehydratase family protein [Corynebacterium doosanense]|uniref:Epimerase n=1 Tax=Corynebacterium doosanense CAU 212 = DSM 45436 TaxID=558173 RepID=A0A097ID85_9CORY|nr:NAD-dependent epimerase/dehydratase family protein [Corynebacterium doosanense]AIT60084.1 epimerase [Corynebacterium doosanense CAU 212 = DSM 45436]